MRSEVNEISVRRVSEADLRIFRKWWKYQALDIDMSFVPANSTYMGCVGGEPAVMVGMIFTAIPLVHLEFFIGNPEIAPVERQRATRALLDHVTSVARAAGYRRFFCMSQHPRLSAYYERLGFTKSSEVTTFTKEI